MGDRARANIQRTGTPGIGTDPLIIITPGENLAAVPQTVENGQMCYYAVEIQKMKVKIKDDEGVIVSKSNIWPNVQEMVDLHIKSVFIES